MGETGCQSMVGCSGHSNGHVETFNQTRDNSSSSEPTKVLHYKILLHVFYQISICIFII